MKKLGEILIEKAIIDQKQLDEALAEQKKSGEFLGAILISKGYIDEEKLANIISSQLGIPYFEGIKDLEIDDFLIKRIPEKIAAKELVVPVEILGNTLTIVMANPMKRSVIDDIQMITGNEIDVMIAPPSQIKAAIERIYKKGNADLENVTQMFEEEVSLDVDVVDEERRDPSSDELLKMSEDKEHENFIKLLIINALKSRASDIHIEPFDEKLLRIRYRIDSILYEQKKYPVSILKPISTIIKIKSKCKIDETRKPQDGRFQYQFGARKIDFRTSFVPTVMGERVEIRIGDKESVKLELDSLGFNDRDVKILKESLNRPWGMILVAGPTGSGKTTTLYSMVNEMYDEDSNVMTVEQPVEFELQGVNQVNVSVDEESIVTERMNQKEKDKALEGYMTFAKALKAFLRQDPDKIMVGEIRDGVTADIAIRAALTGHMVVSSLHTNDAPSVITRLMNIGVPNFLISAALICVVAQKLIRKICEKCKEEVRYTDEELEKMHIDWEEVRDIPKFFRGKGCSFCANTGYYKRTAVYEVMPLTETMQNLIMNRGSVKAMRDLALAEGMLTLRQQAILKVKEGIVTLEEMARNT
mgnify:CR=1 FL=1